MLVFFPLFVVLLLLSLLSLSPCGPTSLPLLSFVKSFICLRIVCLVLTSIFAVTSHFVRRCPLCSPGRVRVVLLHLLHVLLDFQQMRLVSLLSARPHTVRPILLIHPSEVASTVLPEPGRVAHPDLLLLLPAFLENHLPRVPDLFGPICLPKIFLTAVNLSSVSSLHRSTSLSSISAFKPPSPPSSVSRCRPPSSSHLLLMTSSPKSCGLSFPSSSSVHLADDVNYGVGVQPVTCFAAQSSSAVDKTHSILITISFIFLEGDHTHLVSLFDADPHLEPLSTHSLSPSFCAS